MVVRQVLFKTIALGERLLQQERETELRSEYNEVKWGFYSTSKGSSLVAQTVKHLPTMRETWVRSLGWEDSLEKEMANHSRTLAWKTPWTEKPGRLQSMRSQRVGHN